MENADKFEIGKRLLEEGKHAEAFEPLLACAKEGNAEAQAVVGLLYYLGQGTERNLQQAIRWLTQAVEQGRGDAAHNLATLYLTCDPEIPSNPEEAKRLYLKARDLGFVVAPDDWYQKMHGVWGQSKNSADIDE